uniref:Uncharacterized protein n=1 Tax=Setaria italica TaxID=4555 RepID=K3YM34_SETIT
MKAVKNPHHLGAGGYATKIAKWRREEEIGYRKLDRYKKNLEEKMREITKQEFLEFLANHGISQTMADPTVSDGFVAPSSVGSIANMRYPVDDIQVDTLCKLVIPYGRKQNKFREVTTGMAVTGHRFPKALPPEYTLVQVFTVLDESCKIDIPTNEGIEVLDIILNASPETSQPSQELPLPDSNVDTEQPKLSHVQGANNEEEQPMLSPIRESLNEDNGTSALQDDEQIVIDLEDLHRL